MPFLEARGQRETFWLDEREQEKPLNSVRYPEKVHTHEHTGTLIWRGSDTSVELGEQKAHIYIEMC